MLASDALPFTRLVMVSSWSCAVCKPAVASSNETSLLGVVAWLWLPAVGPSLGASVTSLL